MRLELEPRHGLRSDAGEELREPAHLHRRLLPLICPLAFTLASLALASCSHDADSSGASDSGEASDGNEGFVDGGSIFDLDATPGEKVRRSLAGCQGNEECHVGGAAGLTFPEGRELANVVGVRSTERPDLFRVAPGDPETSYLYLKIAHDGGIEGGAMPLGTGSGDPRFIALVHAWIEAGAPPP